MAPDAILAFDDQLDGGGNGGAFAISIASAPIPTIDSVTVDPFGRFNSRTGSATVTGTVVCGGADEVFLESSLEQKAGRFTVTGFGFATAGCDGSTQRWSAEVFPINASKFAGGKALDVTIGFACNELDCSTGFASHRVLLRGK